MRGRRETGRKDHSRFRVFRGLILLGASCVALSACAKSDQAADSKAPLNLAAADSAAQAITADSLLQHIKDLAADSMEGRGPGTPGEEKAVAYLEKQYKA